MIIAAREKTRTSAVATNTKLVQSLLQEVDTLLVGGNQLFREGLKRLFEGSPVMVAGEADSLAEAVSSLEGGAPAVVVLLQVPNSAAEVEAMRRAWPETRVVVLAGQGDAGAMSRAMEAGIDGYLLTDMSPAALIHSISLVVMGENVFPTRLAFDLFRGGRGMEAPERRSTRLTRREIDILHGLLDGLSNKVIARNLGTTDATVKAQLRHLLRKIGAENRTQAALWARENGVAAMDSAAREGRAYAA